MVSTHVNVRRLLVGAVVASVSIGALLFGANTASADSIQVQSYQRSSQSEACTAQAGETAWQTSWGADSSWKPSWEQWANGGTGGWTCTRSITWARTPVAGSGGSVSYAVGDIGPGGGLVFLIDNGVHYEMAPANWGAGGKDEGRGGGGGADCIFVGARGVRGLERFLLGSVSTTVATNAHCSVEIVHRRPPRATPPS